MSWYTKYVYICRREREIKTNEIERGEKITASKQSAKQDGEKEEKEEATHDDNVMEIDMSLSIGKRKKREKTDCPHAEQIDNSVCVCLK